MQSQGKIQKWGNSSAIRLSAIVLAAAGIKSEDEVDIQAEDGRLVIQLRERTQEQAFDQLFAEEPGAKELLALVKQSLTDAIALTDKTTKDCNLLADELDNNGIV